jgi:hypothetical protein
MEIDLASALRKSALQVLLAANTLARAQIESSRDASWTGDDPCAINIYTPFIERRGLAERVNQFSANVHLMIEGRVLDVLRIQIEQAIFRSPCMVMQEIEKITAATTKISFPGDNDSHEGLLQMLIEYQCTDTFEPYVQNTPLSRITMQVPNPTISGGIVSGVVSGALIEFDTSISGASIHV